MAAIAAAWPYLMAAGTAIGSIGQLQQGKAQEQAANFEASQLETNAGQTRAAAIQKGLEAKRQSKIAQSRATALASASGAGTGGTVIDIVSDLAREGAYRQALSLYEGESQAQGLETAARAKRYEGLLSRKMGKLGAFTTLLSGAGSIGAKYGLRDSRLG